MRSLSPDVMPVVRASLGLGRIGFLSLLLVLGVGCAKGGQKVPSPTPEVSEHPLFRQLLDPAHRDAAFCALLKERRYVSGRAYGEPSDCRVTHALASRVPGGRRMAVVFHNVDPTLYPFAGPGIAGGPFTLVDEEGHLVSAFASANVMSKDDRVLRLTPEGELALAQDLRYAESLAWSVRVLHVTPVTPSQEPVLSVLLGPASLGQDGHFQDEASWAWRVVAPQEQLPIRIEIGPRGADGELEQVAATFTYDAATRRFVGPTGGGGADFMRADGLELDPFYDEVERWAARSIVRVGDLVEDLPVDHTHEVVEGAELELLGERWPIPSDGRRRLLLRTRSACALQTLQLRLEDVWTGTISPNGPPLHLPLEVLRGQRRAQRLELSVMDACGARLMTTLAPPP